MGAKPELHEYNPMTDKGALFRVALTISGMSLREWATLHGVSEKAVYALLGGTMTSARLTEAVTQYIRTQIPALRSAIDGFTESA